MRQLTILAGLLAAGLSTSCGSSEPIADGDVGQTVTGARPGRARAPSEAELDLVGMLAPVPEYEGVGRNLFAFGATRRPAPAAPPAPRAARPTPPGNGGQTRPPQNRTPSRASRLNVKYAGYVEKTEPSGDKAKYAIFLSGTEILAGAEGDTVFDFTVVSIGLESVTVSARGSSATERIPLAAN